MIFNALSVDGSSNVDQRNRGSSRELLTCFKLLFTNCSSSAGDEIRLIAARFESSQGCQIQSMSSTTFDVILGLHAIIALVWLGSLLAGLSPSLKLYGSSADVSAFKRGLMLRWLIAGSGGVAVIMGLLLYYYVAAVAKSFAPSSSGAPLVAAGAILGALVFIVSTLQSRSLRIAFKARIEQSMGALSGGIHASTIGPVRPSNSQKLPSKGLLISMPIILVVALLLMIAGSMM